MLKRKFRSGVTFEKQKDLYLFGAKYKTELRQKSGTKLAQNAAA